MSVVLVVALFLTFVVLLLAFFYLKFRCPSELSKLPSIPLLETLGELIRPVGVDERYRLHPELWEVPLWSSFRGSWLVNVNDPEIARQIFTDQDTFTKFQTVEVRPNHPSTKLFGINLVNARGEMWRKQRKIVNPSFQKKNLIKIANTFFSDCVHNLLQQLEKVDNKPIEVHSWMQRMTLDVLGKAGFNYEIGSIEDPKSPPVVLYEKMMKGVFSPLTFLIPEPFGTMFAQMNKELNKNVNQFNDLLLSVIEKRRQKRELQGEEEEESTDLLKLMIESVDDESGTGLSDEELRANVMIFFLAGHDTTAHALSTALFFLASRQDLQERAREEVRRVVHSTNASDGSKTGNRRQFVIPTYEQQRQFEFLTAFVKEGMRIFPSVMSLPGRVTSRPVDLVLPESKSNGEGEKLLRLPQGTMLSIAIFALHHHPKLWDKPFEFDPERFLNQQQKDEEGEASHHHHHPYAWIPFGASARSCIGQDFSLIEQRICLGAILLRYKLKLIPGGEELKLRPGTILAAPKDLFIQFERI